MKKYRFSARGSFTVNLRRSYTEEVKNKMGEVLYVKFHPPLSIVFNNGYAETDSEEKMHAIVDGGCNGMWGSIVYWHPSMGDDLVKDKVLAKDLEQDKFKRAKRRKKQIAAALEGGVEKE